jgi:hypothetical protein
VPSNSAAVIDRPEPVVVTLAPTAQIVDETELSSRVPPIAEQEGQSSLSPSVSAMNDREVPATGASWCTNTECQGQTTATPPLLQADDAEEAVQVELAATVQAQPTATLAPSVLMTVQEPPIHRDTIAPPITVTPIRVELTTAATSYVIVNTLGRGMVLREAPGSARRGRLWPDGSRLDGLGAQQEGYGWTWLLVRDPDGNDGWIPSAYVALASNGQEGVTVPTATPPPPAVTPISRPAHR